MQQDIAIIDMGNNKKTDPIILSCLQGFFEGAGVEVIKRADEGPSSSFLISSDLDTAQKILAKAKEEGVTNNYEFIAIPNEPVAD